MEDDNRVIDTIKVLGLQKKPNDPTQGYWLYGRNGETVNLAFTRPGDLFWHISDDLDCVKAQIEYKSEEKNEIFIKSVTFFGPSDKIRILVEAIGFGTV